MVHARSAMFISAALLMAAVPAAAQTAPADAASAADIISDDADAFHLSVLQGQAAGLRGEGLGVPGTSYCVMLHKTAENPSEQGCRGRASTAHIKGWVDRGWAQRTRDRQTREPEARRHVDGHCRKGMIIM